jgi:hypothetical protein
VGANRQRRRSRRAVIRAEEREVGGMTVSTAAPGEVARPKSSTRVGGEKGGDLLNQLNGTMALVQQYVLSLWRIAEMNANHMMYPGRCHKNMLSPTPLAFFP